MTKNPNWKPYMKRYKRFNELSDRERKEFLRRIVGNSQATLRQLPGNSQATIDTEFISRFYGIIEEDNKDEEL